MLLAQLLLEFWPSKAQFCLVHFFNWRVYIFFFNIKIVYFKKPILIINNDGIEDLIQNLKIYWYEIVKVDVQTKKFSKHKNFIFIDFLIEIEYSNGNVLVRDRNMPFYEKTIVTKEDVQQRILYFLKMKNIKLAK